MCLEHRPRLPPMDASDLAAFVALALFMGAGFVWAAILAT